MTLKPKALFSWSSGKDSALALERIKKAGEFEVAGLVTTISEAFSRVAIHGVREALLDRQSDRLELPLEKIRLPNPCPNAVYETKMAGALVRAKTSGVTHVIYGDLFLADIRAYREQWLGSLKMTPVFPLWGEDTEKLAREMIAGGIKAVLTCVDTQRLEPSFAGREFDEALLAALPSSCDPCGENGEFHTFVHDSPLFSRPIPINVGERVRREQFEFADVTERQAE